MSIPLPSDGAALVRPEKSRRYMSGHYRGRNDHLRNYLDEIRPRPGYQIRIGMAHHQQIWEVTHKMGYPARIERTTETCIRDDGLKVPVWLVTFK